MITQDRMRRRLDILRVKIEDVDINAQPFPRATGRDLAHHGTVDINLAHGVGDQNVIPDIGQVWWVERRFGLHWRLSHIYNTDPTTYVTEDPDIEIDPPSQPVLTIEAREWKTHLEYRGVVGWHHWLDVPSDVERYYVQLRPVVPDGAGGIQDSNGTTYSIPSGGHVKKGIAWPPDDLSVFAPPDPNAEEGDQVVDVGSVTDDGEPLHYTFTHLEHPKVWMWQARVKAVSITGNHSEWTDWTDPVLPLTETFPSIPSPQDGVLKFSVREFKTHPEYKAHIRWTDVGSFDIPGGDHEDDVSRYEVHFRPSHSDGTWITNSTTGGDSGNVQARKRIIGDKDEPADAKYAIVFDHIANPKTWYWRWRIRMIDRYNRTSPWVHEGGAAGWSNPILPFADVLPNPPTPTGVTFSTTAREYQTKNTYNGFVTFNDIGQWDVAADHDKEDDVALYNLQLQPLKRDDVGGTISGGDGHLYRMPTGQKIRRHTIHDKDEDNANPYTYIVPFGELPNPRTWYWRARVRSVDRFNRRGSWSSWTTPALPATVALPAPPAPAGVVVSYWVHEYKTAPNYSAKVAFQDVSLWNPNGDTERDPEDDVDRYLVQLRPLIRDDGAGTISGGDGHLYRLPSGAVIRRSMVHDKDEDNSNPFTYGMTFQHLANPRSWYYQARVRSHDRFNRRGPWSAWTTPTLPSGAATVTIPVPTNVSIGNIDRLEQSRHGQFRVTASCDEVGQFSTATDRDPELDVDKYEFQLRVTDSGGTVDNSSGSYRTIVVEAKDQPSVGDRAKAIFLGLKPRAYVNARVRAIDKHNRKGAFSGWCTPVFTRDNNAPTAPTAPVNGVFFDVDRREIEVKWGYGNDAVDSELVDEQVSYFQVQVALDSTFSTIFRQDKMVDGHVKRWKVAQSDTYPSGTGSTPQNFWARVRALDSAGNKSAWYPSTSGQIGNALQPSAPIIPVFTYDSVGVDKRVRVRVKVRWGSIAMDDAVNHYVLQFRTRDADDWVGPGSLNNPFSNPNQPLQTRVVDDTEKETVDGVANSLQTIFEVAKGKKLWARVKAVDLHGLTGPWSNWSTTQTAAVSGPSAPPSPTLASLPNAISIQVVANADAQYSTQPDQTVASYKVEVDATDNTFTHIVKTYDGIPPNPTTPIVHKTASLVTHFVRVTAIDLTGQVSSPSSVVSATPSSGAVTDGRPPNTPLAPTVSVSAIAYGIRTSWTAVTTNDLGAAQNDPVTYEVWYGTSSGFTRASGGTKAGETTGLAFNITGLTAGTPYFVKVLAKDQDGFRTAPNDLSSASVSATPVAYATDATGPSGTSPTPEVRGGVGYLQVKWPAPGQVGGMINNDLLTYEVHVSLTPGFTAGSTTKAGETMGTMFFIKVMPDNTPLDYTQQYYVRLVAKDPDAAATQSAQVGPTAMVPAGENDIAANAIFARHINALQIDVDRLASVLLITNVLKTAEGGQRVEITQHGVTLYGIAPISITTVALQSGTTYRFTSQGSHSLAVGSPVTLSGFTPAGYNGTWLVTNVVSTTQFDADVLSNPGAVTVLGSFNKEIVLIDLPTEGDPRFQGKVIATALDVLSGLTMSGTNNILNSGATLTLQNAIQSSQNKPTAKVVWPDRVNLSTLNETDPQGNLASPRRIDYDPSGFGSVPTYLISWSGVGTDGVPNYMLAEYKAADMTKVRTIQNWKWGQSYGVARVGTAIYHLGRFVNSFNLDRFSQTTGAFQASRNIASDFPNSSFGGVFLAGDGTTLYIFETKDQSNWQSLWRYATVTLSSVGVWTQSAYTNLATTPINVFTDKDWVVAESRVWVAANADPALGTVVTSWTTAGAWSNQHDFSGPSAISCLTHDGTTFRSAVGQEIILHTSWDWTTESAKYWIRYTWYEDIASGGTRNAGDYESGFSPNFKSTDFITMIRRAAMSITTSQLPTPVNGGDTVYASIYVNRGASAPANTDTAVLRQIDSTDSTVILRSFNASGSGRAQSGETVFPIGNPAALQTQDGSPLIRANGLPRMKAHNDRNQSIPNNTTTPVDFELEDIDTDSFFTPGGPPGTPGTAAVQNITIPFSGQYMLLGRIAWATGNVLGYRKWLIQKDVGAGFSNTSTVDTRAASPNGNDMPLSGFLDAMAGDKIRVVVQHTDTAALNLVTTCTIALVFLGPS